MHHLPGYTYNMDPVYIVSCMVYKCQRGFNFLFHHEAATGGFYPRQAGRRARRWNRGFTRINTEILFIIIKLKSCKSCTTLRSRYEARVILSKYYATRGIKFLFLDVNFSFATEVTEDTEILPRNSRINF